MRRAQKHFAYVRLVHRSPTAGFVLNADGTHSVPYGTRRHDAQALRS